MEYSKKDPRAFLQMDTPIWKKIFKISFPLMLLSLTNGSYLLVDAILSSYLVEQYSATAVLGVVLPFLMLFSSTITVIIVGTGLYIPRKLGEGKDHEVEKIFGQGIFLAFFYGFIIFSLLFIIAPYWVNGISELSASPLSQNQIDAGIAYIRVSGIIFAPMMFRDVIARTLRVEGRSFSSVLIPIIAIPVNLTFDWIFMGVFDWGLVGAAYATVIGVTLGALMAGLFGIFLRYKNSTHINFKFQNLMPDFLHVKEICLFGVGPFIRRFTQTLFTVAALFFIIRLQVPNYYEDNYWKEFMTASSRVMSFLMIISLAFTQGSALVISYYYGKKEYSSVKESVKICAILVVISNILAAILIISLTNQILHSFGIDSQTNNYRNALYILAASLPLTGVSTIFVTYYASVRDVKSLFTIVLIGTFVFAIPILSLFYYVVYLNTENSSLFFAGYMCIGICQTLFFTPIFYKEYRKLA